MVSVKKIDADNLVTNAWKYRMNQLIMYKNNSEYLLPIAETLLGGVMLFDGALEDSADNIVFPGNAHLVGYGDRGSDTSDPCRGTFNELESGRTDRGYTLVWDFSTSQCNDTVKSIALAHKDIVYHLKRGLNTGTSSLGLHALLYHDGNYWYAVDVSSAKKLWMNRGARPFEISVHTRPNYDGDNLNSFKTIDVSDDFDYSRSTQYWAYSEPGYITTHEFSYSGSRGSYLSSLWYAKIRTSDWEYIPKQTIQIDGLPNTRLQNFCSAGGYYYARNYDGGTTLYRLDPANPVDIRTITFDSKYTNITPMGRTHSGVITGKLEDPSSGYGTSDERRYKIAYIYPDGTVKIIKSGTNIGWEVPIGYSERLTPANSYLADVYLGTICNLSSPVTKTAATTMKVIYTLTDT